LDIGFATPDDTGLIQAGIHDIGQLDGWLLTPAYKARVMKRGWKTGLTHGTLWYKDISFVMSYSAGEALFTGQYGVVGDKDVFAKEGDSGAIVVDEERHGVAIVFAVATGMDLTLATPIETLLTQFPVEPAN
jgi:hypothetical protein